MRSFKNPVVILVLQWCILPAEQSCQFSEENNDELSVRCDCKEIREGDFTTDNQFCNTTNYYVRYLFIEETQIKNIGLLFEVFYDSPYVYQVTVTNSQISEFGVAPFQLLTDLTHLDLHNDRIQSVTKSSFVGLYKLVYLNLSHNSITQLDSNALKNLTNLQTLDLSFNNILTIKNSTFRDLISVRFLDISNNNIRELDRNVFKNTKKLMMLDLSYNRLNAITTNNFVDLETLQTLNLASNFIYSLSDHAFWGLNSLSFLNVSNNSVQELSLGSLSGIPSVQVLDLSYNRLSILEPGVFSLVVKITALNISHNDLTRVDERAFFPLQFMTTLEIEDNKLEYMNFIFLISHVKSIKYMSISENPWSSCSYMKNVLRYLESHGVDFSFNVPAEYKINRAMVLYCKEFEVRLKTITMEEHVTSHEGNISEATSSDPVTNSSVCADLDIKYVTIITLIVMIFVIISLYIYIWLKHFSRHCVRKLSVETGLVEFGQ